MQVSCVCFTHNSLIQMYAGDLLDLIKPWTEVGALVQVGHEQCSDYCSTLHMHACIHA